MELSDQLHAPQFYPRERVTGCNWVAGWMDTRTCLDTVVKREISASPAN